MTDEQHTGRCRMAEDVKMLPCPFCGGRVFLHHGHDGIGFVTCGQRDSGSDGCGAITSFRPSLGGARAKAAWNRRAHDIDALREEVERLRLRDAQLCDATKLIEARAERAEAEVAMLREALAAAPGGHSCEEFHHGKADRHLPGEPCPPKERWEAALAALSRAANDTQAGGVGREVAAD